MKTFFKLTLFIFTISIPFQLLGQNSLSIIQKFTNDEALKNAAISIYVENIDSNRVLLASTPQLCIIPASVLKLITSATAIEMLGEDFRFSTHIWANGELKNRKLNGDLVITAGGDPTLGSAYFNTESHKKDFLAQWVLKIKQHGIDTITGNIIVDPSIYSDRDVPQTWIWEDLGNYFGAAAQGLALYDNTFELVFKTAASPGSPAEIIDTIPFIPNLCIQNEVIASGINSDRANVFGSPFDSYRVIKGTLPQNNNAFKIKASIPDPSILLAHELKQMLSDSFITILGQPMRANVITPKPSTPDSFLCIWESPALGDIIVQLNRESVNLFAEHLIKHIGYYVYGNGTTANGVRAIQSFWNEKGVETKNLFIADGSGLSRVNAITAKSLVEILSYMYKNSKSFNKYLSSVPITGLQGTQQYYFQQSFLKGKVHAKSGSMKRVRSFAGYMTTPKGTQIAFAIIVNNFDCGSFVMAEKMEKVLEEIYSEF